MTKDVENRFAPLLSGLGFVPESRPNWILWRYDGSLASVPLAQGQERAKSRKSGRGSAAARFPWRLERFEVAERKGRLQLHRMVIRLDSEALRACLAAATRKYFGVRTRADFVAGKDGGTWCIFEFSRHGSRAVGGDGSRSKASREKPQGNAQTAAGALLPHGLGGFDLRIAPDGGVVAAILSDAFGVGFLPQNFASAPLRLIGDAFGLKPLGDDLLGEARASSIHELRIPLTLIGLACLAELRGLAKNQPGIDSLRKLYDLMAQGRPAATREQAQVVADAQGVTVAMPGSDEVVPELTSVPLEVLESRERGKDHPDLDLTILGSKYKKAARLAALALEDEPRDLFLLRRMALLGLAGQKEWTPDFVARSLGIEGGSKLFLSAAVNRALEDGDQMATLRLLSRLGARLVADVQGFESLGTFDVVLPELLGDAWCNEDRRKAEECYLRIIQRRGDLPRILRKLINLAKASGRPDGEAAYLRRLANVERRRVELAKIYLRLAELRRAQASGRDEAIQLALRAVKLDPSLFAATLLAGELLFLKGDVAEAIALLDGVLRDPSATLTPKARSRLEGMIGRIWYRGLNRPDLAETRLRQSVAHDAANVESLKDLEDLYRSGQDLVGLAGVLESRFDVHEKAGDSDALHQTFEELSALYRDVMGEPRKAYDLYQRLLLSASVGHQEIDRVLAWRDVEIDWQDLYAKLLAKVAQVPVGETRGRFLCRLAEICREKLGDDENALRHQREALESGWIDAGGFDFIVERLTKAGDYEALARCYELRIDQANGDDRRRLVLELLALPSVLSDVKRDELAIQAYSLDPDADKAVHQRLRFYQSVDDVGAIARVIDGVLSDAGAGELERIGWLKVGIEALEACIDDQRFGLIERLYRLLIEIGEDRPQILRDAVTSLRQAPDAALVVPYLARMLEAGIVPPVDERQMLRYLAGLDHELALFHQLMSIKAVAAQDAAQHARTAAVLYAKRANQEANTEKMLGRVGMLAPCSEADLNDLKELVQKTGNWSLMAKVLQKQVDFEDERRRKFALLEWLGRIYWQKLKDYGRSRMTLVLALQHAPEPWRMKIALATLASEAKETSHERKALIEFLQDAKAPEQTSVFGKAVQRLLKLGEEPATLQRTIMPLINAATERGKHDLAGSLSAILLDNQIATTEIYRSAFTAAVSRRDTDRAIDVWWRGLASVANRSKAKAYMAETKLILEREDRDDLLQACFKAALENDVGARLGPKIKQEILFQYGALLFDDDAKRHKALAIYREAHDVDPENSRSWMPLYFLLLEFGTPEARYAHLADIVPRLEQDPRPLKSFPITIESLQAEYRELAEQLGEVPAERRQVAGEPSGYSEPLTTADDPAPFTVPGTNAGEGSYDDTSIATVSLADDRAELPALSVGGGLDVSGDLSLDVGGVNVDLAEFAQASADAGPLAIDLGDFGASAPEDVQVASASGFSIDLDVGEPVAVAETPTPLSFALDDAAGAMEGGTQVNLGDAASIGMSLDVEVDVGDASAEVSVDLGEEQGAVPASGVPGSFSLDVEAPAGAQQESAPSPEIVRNAIPPEHSGLLEFGAAGSALSPAALAGEVSSVELAAAVNDSEGSMDATVRADSAVVAAADGSIGEQSGLPLPAAGDASVLSSSQQSLPGPPRFGSGVSSVSKVSESSFSVDAADDVTDWRAAVIKGDFNADLTSRLLKQAFASEIEKHLAIQCVALVAGNCDRLANWHWRVWRNPDEYGYLRSGKDRYPADAAPASLASSLYKFVIATTPLMVKVFRDRFTSDYIGRKLKMPPGGVEKIRKAIPWHEGLMAAAGFKAYADRFTERRFVVYNLPGLGRELFYEGGSRSLYLDEAYYRKQPPSHLFHRVLGTLWSVRNHTFVPLALNPQKHVLPLFREVNQYFGAHGFSRIKSRLSSGSSVVVKALSAMDTQQLKPLHEKVGMPSEEQVVQLWEAMRVHIFRLLLAETLDVVGLMEMLTQRDLLKPDAVKHSEIYQLSLHARAMIEFATKLKL